jgi:hypothetical protein
MEGSHDVQSAEAIVGGFCLKSSVTQNGSGGIGEKPLVVDDENSGQARSGSLGLGLRHR